MTPILPTPPAVGTFSLQSVNGVLQWTDADPPDVLRAAFFYPWFPAAWNQQGYDPFSNYIPSVGFYSSNNVPIIEGQINAMQYGHLDAAIVSWWGQNSQEDAVVPVLLRTALAMNTGFKFCMYYELESIGDPTVATIEGDLAYIKAKYGSHPNYLTIGGKPVIFVYASGTDGVGMAARWGAANAVADFYVVLKVFPGYQSVAASAQGWHQYGPAVAVDHQVGYSFTVSPGYYKKGDSAPMLVRNMIAWQSSLVAMVASGEPLQLVTTLNEFGEGTAVESAIEWASPSGFGTYLDAMHDIIPAH